MFLELFGEKRRELGVSLRLSAAVQEERQRNKEREGEVESTSAVNEEMPVEKILEAEMAVEQKTELHADGSSGGSSVSSPHGGSFKAC